MADVIFPGQTPQGDLGQSSLPSNYDIVFWRGDAQTFILTWNDSSNNPVNLTGYTAKAAIKASFSSTTQYPFTCTIQNTNQVKMYMSTAVSSTIPAGTYVWDFKIVDSVSGDQHTYLAGDVVVYDEVAS